MAAPRPLARRPLFEELFRHNALMASVAALACPSSFDGSSIFTMGGIP